jgi:hypothetical protein
MVAGDTAVTNASVAPVPPSADFRFAMSCAMIA